MQMSKSQEGVNGDRAASGDLPEASRNSLARQLRGELRNIAYPPWVELQADKDADAAESD
jgi:hypothetical protein